ncbi:hypothetical protein [Mycobacterium kubicae]|uniref:hypothetical protein n=1 Tax=Mycobacterium kubicae TaxID=120959 RepID=UPI0010425766|nr:hypothetical protein [Mycobacterium kubicae]
MRPPSQSRLTTDDALVFLKRLSEQAKTPIVGVSRRLAGRNSVHPAPNVAPQCRAQLSQDIELRRQMIREATRC